MYMHITEFQKLWVGTGTVANACYYFNGMVYVKVDPSYGQ